MDIEELYIDKDYVKSGISSSNIYSVDSKVLIDVGSSGNAGQKEFEDFSEIETVVITYAHETHTDNLEKFSNRNIEIYCAEPQRWEIKHYAPNQEIHYLEDKDTLELAGYKFQVLIFEDSTINRKKLALYSPENKILFSGDVSLENFEDLDVKQIYPAHKRPIKESVQEAISDK